MKQVSRVLYPKGFYYNRFLDKVENQLEWDYEAWNIDIGQLDMALKSSLRTKIHKRYIKDASLVQW